MSLSNNDYWVRNGTKRYEAMRSGTKTSCSKEWRSRIYFPNFIGTSNPHDFPTNSNAKATTFQTQLLFLWGKRRLFEKQKHSFPKE